MIVRKMHTGGYQELVVGKEETEGGAVRAAYRGLIVGRPCRK